jgi:ribosomal protein S20
MAKRVKKKAAEAWRTQWPRNGDLKSWFRAMIRKCDAIADDEEAADKAHLPIEALAEKGSVSEALRHVNRYLRRLPREEVLPTVRLARLGAQICVNAGDLAGMEKYLAIMAATEAFNTRKCDKGFSINSVRKFRAENGLLDPAEAMDDEERFTAQFEGAARRCNEAIAAGEHKSAKAAVAEMEKVARGARQDWRRRFALQEVIQCHAKLKNTAAIKEAVRGLKAGERDKILNAEMFNLIGMKEEAIARAGKEISRELEELRTMTDPNIHFPVMAISDSLELLVAQGARDEAKKWLRRTLKEMPTWPVFEQGWLTSGVYTSLAEAAAKVEGPDAAEELLEHAMKDAKVERRSGWRKGAVDAALDLKADLGHLDAAIADARKLRSPTQRRETLAKLLARARRWSELREVLSEVASPTEAAEVAWWLKFELPGGEAK